MVDTTGFVNDGLELIAEFIANNAPSPPQSLEFGTGTSPTVPTDSTLETPTGGGPHVIESRARLGIGQTALAVTLGLTSPENGKSITEAGVFDGTSGSGTDKMYARRSGVPFNKTPNVLAIAQFIMKAEDRSIL